MAKTLLDKMSNDHGVAELDDGPFFPQVDRHLLHEATNATTFDGLWPRGAQPRNPGFSVAVIDHVPSTVPGPTGETFEGGRKLVELIRRNTRTGAVRLSNVDDERESIVHIMARETGIALPSLTRLCGDSHTATSGGIGAFAWGIDTFVDHALRPWVYDTEIRADS